MELQRNAAKYRASGLGVAAISYDSIPVLKNFAERKGIVFPLLSDPKSEIIRSVGILNTDVPHDNFAFGIPYPVTFLINAKGVITAKYFEEDFRERPASAAILLHQFGIAPDSAATVAGKQLTASISSSNAIVHAGERITLAVEIDLRPNMHVYAPGVEGYIPIDWTMEPSTAYASDKVIYPQAETLFLSAIDEKVPVYQGKVRLLRDITIAQDTAARSALDAGGALAIAGSLRYQACDDRKCYIPETLPLRLTVRYEALDRTRAPAELQRKPSASAPSNALPRRPD